MKSSIESISAVPSCKRCGTCCRNGGPALHTEDISLLGGSLIPLSRLVTIRDREPAYDQQNSQPDLERGEFIKLAGTAGNWCCTFWNEAESSCGIYEIRPLECRLLFCEDTSAINKVMGKSLLTRKDILGSDDELMKIIRQHETECSYNLLNTLVAEFLTDISANRTVEKINVLVRKDLQIRAAFFASRPQMLQMEMFLFGRPVFITLIPYGFEPVETHGSIFMKYSARDTDTLRSATI